MPTIREEQVKTRARMAKMRESPTDSAILNEAVRTPPWTHKPRSIT